MNRRKKGRYTLQLLMMLFSIMVLAVVAWVFYLEFRPMVVKAVTMEAGKPMVDIKEFLKEKSSYGYFITDINNLELNKPGSYEVRIKVRNRVYTSILEVVDRTAPTAETIKLVALKDEDVEPETIIKNISDVTEVSCSWKKEPDTSHPGEQEVTVVLEDTSHNKTELTTSLKVLDIKNTVQLEAGSEMMITPEDLVEDDKYDVSFLTDPSEIDISKPGKHEIQIEVDGRILTSIIEVIDTTPPTATAVDLEVWKDETVEAKSFAKDVLDTSGVQFSFVGNPDFTQLGSHEITILMMDTYGNTSELKAMVTVKEDQEPPVFSGVRDKTVYVGDSVSYKKNISVIDNKDEDLTFEVDSSKVNLKKVGTYEVRYSAIDSAGNKAEATSIITVEEFLVSDEMLYEAVDKILAEITNDSMTKREKAKEIYQYVRGHVAYTGSSDKSDWKKEAYRGIKNAVGDCFTYYAVSEAMLTRAGIENMKVTRVGGRTKHFWNLINCGDGWYHFDSCPHKDKIQSFMLTDAEVEEYTKKRGNNYYTFDKSLYPATPKE